MVGMRMGGARTVRQGGEGSWEICSHLQIWLNTPIPCPQKPSTRSTTTSGNSCTFTQQTRAYSFYIHFMHSIHASSSLSDRHWWYTYKYNQINPHINSRPPQNLHCWENSVSWSNWSPRQSPCSWETLHWAPHTLPARCSTSVHLSVHIIFVRAHVCLMCANCTLQTRSHSNPLKSAGLTSTALRCRISLTIARWTVDTPLSPIPRAEAGSWKSRSVDWK